MGVRTPRVAGIRLLGRKLAWGEQCPWVQELYGAAADGGQGIKQLPLLGGGGGQLGDCGKGTEEGEGVVQLSSGRADRYVSR